VVGNARYVRDLLILTVHLRSPSQSCSAQVASAP